VASQPLQVYDYGSLVDRWYAVYDKHYRSQPVIPQAAYASTRYDAVWDQGSNVTASGTLGLPTTSALSLEDLRRIAIEGFSGFSRSSASTTGEGNYISLPLEGRLDLMRPRPGPGMGGESGAGEDGQRAPGASARDLLTFDDNAGPATPKVRPHSFYASDLPHGRSTSDSAPYEHPSAPHLDPEPGAMISFASGLPRQPVASARWQIQPGPTSSLPQDQARSYYSAGYNPWTSSGPEPQYSQGTGGRHVRDVQEQYASHQHTIQSDSGTGGSISLSGQIEGAQPVGIYPQGVPEYPHGQHQLFLPFERDVSTFAASMQPAQRNTEQIPESQRQRGLSQESVYQITQRLPQTYQTQDAQEPRVQGELRAPNFDAQQVHPELFLRRDPEHTHEHGHQQAPPQEPLRPVSPPLMVWNPAVEPPPNTAPVSNFPTTTYYPNVWDQSPTHYRSDSSRATSPTQGTPASFTMPPPSRIPERLLQEKHYVNVLGERQQGETPSPDRAKIKPVFPWEDKPRLTPGRVFPTTDSPPPGQFLLPAVQPASPSPSPPLRYSPTQPYTSSPPSGFPPSFSYSNAWDSVPSIQKYASRLVRPSQYTPPQAPLGPAFDLGESRRRESALFRNWQESGESSVDGDDEDTGDEGGQSPPSKPRPRSGSSSGKSKKKEYRSQGVQTIPKETRDQSVQVTILTDPLDANRSIKDKDQMSPRSREGSFSGLSPALATKQQDLPPSRTRLQGPATSYTGDLHLPKLSPLGSPTGLRSPRYASPRGSSTNLAESTPRPVLYKPTQRPSTPQRGGELQRLPPSSISRTFSSDTASSPSSAGPPISPTDIRPIQRAGGRAWDPARGVEIFKRGSEEVLARFLKMGSWEEEKQSQSPT
jgi:glycogenin glucosyltransferase